MYMLASESHPHFMAPYAHNRRSIVAASATSEVMQTLFHCQERESRESSAGIFCIDRFFQLTLMRMKNSLRVATSDYFHYISQSARVRNDRWYSGQRALAIISCESHYIKVEFLKRAGYKKLILNKFNLKMVPRDKKEKNVKKEIKDGN